MANSFFERLKARKNSKKPKKPETFGESVVSWIKTILGAIVVVMIINGAAIASFVVPTGSMENTVMTGDFLFVNKFIYGPTTPQIVPFFNIPLPFYKFPGIKNPEKGDVIVFIYPGDRDMIKPDAFTYYLKRCVATAGDIIEVRNKVLFVNGIQSPKPPKSSPILQELMPGDQYKTYPVGRNFTRDNYGPLRIPKKGDVVELNSQNIREWDTFIAREGHQLNVTTNDIFVDGKKTNKYTVERNYCFGMGDNRENSLDSRYWGLIPWDNVVGTPIIVYWSWDTNIPIGKIIDKIGSSRLGRVGTLIH